MKNLKKIADKFDKISAKVHDAITMFRVSGPSIYTNSRFINLYKILDDKRVVVLRDIYKGFLDQDFVVASDNLQNLQDALKDAFIAENSRGMKNYKDLPFEVFVNLIENI